MDVRLTHRNFGIHEQADFAAEVAETLAYAVSSYCDAREGGWRLVADQWLQPGGPAHEDFSACYRLLYSLSEHFDPGLI